MIIKVVLIVLAVIVLTALLVSVFLYMLAAAIGGGLAMKQVAEEDAWKELPLHVKIRTHKAWDSLSDAEREHRIACVAICLSDCGILFTEDEIIGYLKGENSKFQFGNDDPWQNLPHRSLTEIPTTDQATRKKSISDTNNNVLF